MKNLFKSVWLDLFYRCKDVIFLCNDNMFFDFWYLISCKQYFFRIELFFSRSISLHLKCNVHGRGPGSIDWRELCINFLYHEIECNMSTEVIWLEKKVLSSLELITRVRVSPTILNCPPLPGKSYKKIEWN